MSQQDLFERIVALLHDAALDDVHWSEAARLVNQATQMRSNGLAISDRRHQPRPELFYFRLVVGRQRRDDLERAHLRDFLLHDESIARLKRLPDGQLAHTADLYTEHEKRTSRTYNLIRDDTRTQNGLNVRLDVPVGSQIVWGLGDSVAPEGWGSAQLEMVSCLLPHLRQFVRVLRAVSDAEALGRSLADLLDNDRFGVIQLDRQGRVLVANDRARGLLQQGDGLCDRDGFLMARKVDENTAFQRLLARALSPPAVQAAAGSMTVRRSSRRARLVVHVNPATRSQWYFRAEPVAALVLVVDPDRPARIDPGFVAEALDLTPAEARLAVMLATGHGIPTIAALRRCTEGTVRWHLKQIFRKQRVSRQADLVRRVLSLDGFPGSER